MADTENTLDEIGIETGTDKSSVHHGYLAFYERFFAKWRHERINILEVGVLTGASLRAWEKYFPNATIVGADIDPQTQRHANARTTIQIINQSNIQDLVSLGVRHGPFDIIIEDGSHFWEHQITTLRTLFPFVKEKGFYIVEDLQTNFGNAADIYRGVASFSCVEYLKRLVDLRVSGDEINIELEEDAFLRTYGKALEFMAFYRHACLIEKMGRRSAVVCADRMTTQLTVGVTGNAPQPFGILGHAGNIGDVENGDSICLNLDVALKSYLQGFMITAPAAMAMEIRYRARLASGLWTEWVNANKFVGSRGRNESLVGFAVELLGGLSAAHDLEVVGAFDRADQLVVVGSGQDCTTKGYLPLRGLQVVIKEKT